MASANPLENELSHVFDHEFQLNRFKHVPFQFTGPGGKAGQLNQDATEHILQRDAGVLLEPVIHYEGVVLAVDISAFTSTSQLSDFSKYHEKRSIAAVKSRNLEAKENTQRSRSKYKSQKKVKSTVVKTLTLGRVKRFEKTDSQLSEMAKERHPSETEEVPPKETLEAADHLRGIVNLYMEAFGQGCLEYGGEIAQVSCAFANVWYLSNVKNPQITGDYMVCVWIPRRKLKAQESTKNLLPQRPKSIVDCWNFAKACAASIITRTIEIQNDHFPGITTLGVHGAMAQGTISRIETEDTEENKRLNFIYGEGVQIASTLMDLAGKYEVLAVGPEKATLVDPVPEEKFTVKFGELALNKDIVGAARRGEGLLAGVEILSKTNDKGLNSIPKVPVRSARDLTAALKKVGLEDSVNEYIPSSVLKFMEFSEGTEEEPSQGVVLDCGVLFVSLGGIGPKTVAEFAPESDIWTSTYEQLSSAVVTLKKIVTSNGGDMVNFSIDDKGCGLMAFFPGIVPIQAAVQCKLEFPDSQIGVTRDKACHCYSGVPNQRAIMALYSKATSYAARIAFHDDVKSNKKYSAEQSIAVQASALKNFTKAELKSIGLSQKAVKDPIVITKAREAQQLIGTSGVLETVNEKFSAVIVNVGDVKAETDHAFDENRNYLEYGHVKTAETTTLRLDF